MLVVALAAPGSANEGTGGGNQSGNSPNENANETAQQAAGYAIEELCRISHVYLNSPSVTWDPLLGMVDLDPDECYHVYVHSPIGTWKYTYNDDE